MASLLGLAIACLLLFFQIGSLTSGFTKSELQQRAATSTIESVTNNPLHLHQKVGQFLAQKFGHSSPAAMRLPSAIIGLAGIVSMCVILKSWYTTRVAVLGTFLFATSSWTLHFARLSTPDINFLLPLLLLVGSIWLHRDKFATFAIILAIISGIFMLYVPGMVWFVVLTIIWRRRLIGRIFKSFGALQQTMAILLVLLGIAPLVWAFTFNFSLVTLWLGFPAIWPSPATYLTNIVSIPKEIFIIGAGDPTYSIGRIPLLDAFTSCMVALGAFVLFFRLGLDRTRILIGATVMSVLLVALGGPVTITLLLPIIYILAGGGIALLLQQWFTVFPRNPVARLLGVIFVSATVLLASGYHLSHYFVAWPNVPATKATFSHQP